MEHPSASEASDLESSSTSHAHMESPYSHSVDEPQNQYDTQPMDLDQENYKHQPDIVSDADTEEVKEPASQAERSPDTTDKPWTEKLRTEFGYEYDAEKKLKNCETGEPFKFVDQKHYERLGDVILEYIQEEMRTTYDLEEIRIPTEAEGPKANIFVSKDLRSNQKGLLILIQGAGAVRAGQWARSVCINDSLQTGTIFPCLDFAKENDWAVVVMNPNYMSDPETRQRIPLIDTPERHCSYIWNNYVSSSPAQSLYLIGHSCGGLCTVSLLANFTEDFESRVRAIALTDSVHGSVYGVSKAGKKLFKKITVDWVASGKKLGAFISGANDSYNGCTNVSSGHKKHEYTTGSAHGQIFEFFNVMRADPLFLTTPAFVPWTNCFELRAAQ